MTLQEKMLEFIDAQEVAGIGLVVNKGGEEVCHLFEGYDDVDKKTLITEHTLFRLCSMSKPVTAVAVMQLVEQGKISLDDPVEKYLPEFKKMKVPSNPVSMEETLAYTADPENPALAAAVTTKLEDAILVEAKRKFTIKDVLNHTAGLGMGLVSAPIIEKCSDPMDKLADRVRKYAQAPLDFEPGTMTGYSGIVGFEILGRLVEIVSGEDFNSYIRKYIADPLGTDELGFEMSEEQLERMASLYERTPEGKLIYATPETMALWADVDPGINGYYSGAAGMIGSLDGYNRFVRMLANKGTFNGKQILKPETVDLMVNSPAEHGLDLMPGAAWGLGMLRFRDQTETGRWLGEGTFGWSGAYGTHFYIDPENDLSICLVSQRSNIGGAMSVVSIGLEEYIYKTFASHNNRI